MSPASSPSGKRQPVKTRDVVVITVLAVIVYALCAPAYRESPFGISINGGKLIIRDFASHFNFARAFWHGGADYSLSTHLRLTSEWAGRPINRALPFGYSPTMLWLLSPLAFLSTFNAYVVWVLLGCAAVIWICRTDAFSVPICAVLLLTPLAFFSFALGQTSILSTAALVALVRRHVELHDDAKSERWSWSLLPDVVLLWALSAKPPLAITAGAALLACRRWKTVTIAVVATIATSVLLTARLGQSWMVDYLSMITHYDLETAPTEFAWSLHPDHMTNLRSVLWYSGVVGDHLASVISSACWIVATGFVVLHSRKSGRDATSVWLSVCAAYLMFCPHLSSTEDMLLVVVATCIAAAYSIRDREQGAIVSTSVNESHAVVAGHQTEVRQLSASAWFALGACALILYLPPEAVIASSAARSILLFVLKGALAVAALMAIDRIAPRARVRRVPA